MITRTLRKSVLGAAAGAGFMAGSEGCAAAFSRSGSMIALRVGRVFARFAASEVAASGWPRLSGLAACRVRARAGDCARVVAGPAVVCDAAAADLPVSAALAARASCVNSLPN